MADLSEHFREQWIRTWLIQCYYLASRSPDRSTQNAAILADGYVSHGSGVNEFPPGVVITEEILGDRDLKYAYIEHAERRAIYETAKLRSDFSQLTMFCPWVACADCARAILLCGVKHVIGHKERMDCTPERWQASIDRGLKILRDGGVTLEFYSGKLDATPVIVNGELRFF